jgi:hypothetical protein
MMQGPTSGQEQYPAPEMMQGPPSETQKESPFVPDKTV